MVALILTTYNRPKYLKHCLESLKMADLSRLTTLLIVDDCSTDLETIKLIDEFNIEAVEVIKYFTPNNGSIKNSLLYGYNLMFEQGHNLVMNLDSDSVVRNDFVDRILEAKEKYPALLITGFNCNTLNKDGSVRHKHLYKENGYTFRASVGGINMCVAIEQYLKYMKPALIHTLEYGGNWDALTCINSMKDSLPICVVNPSVIQHIGLSSSMNHNAGGEPPDTAADFKLLSLPNVTLVSVSDDIDSIIKVANISREDIDFGAVKLFSHKKPVAIPYGIECIEIEKLGSKQAYSRFIFDRIVDYIETDFFLIIQADGYVLNAKSWRNEFLEYDAVGAKWCWYEFDRCCNGGFSLKSRKMHQIIKNDPNIFLTNDHIINDYQEDHNWGRIYRKYLEDNYNIKYAPDDVCDKFSIEAYRNPNPKYQNSFGFHGANINFKDAVLKHKPY